MTLVTTNGATSPFGASTIGAFGSDARIYAWKAPRTCTVTGTIVLVGGVTASTVFVGIRVRDASGASILRTSFPSFDSSYVSGTVRTLGPLLVNAGELLHVVEIAVVGLALLNPTVAYTSLSCS